MPCSHLTPPPRSRCSRCFGSSPLNFSTWVWCCCGCVLLSVTSTVSLPWPVWLRSVSMIIDDGCSLAGMSLSPNAHLQMPARKKPSRNNLKSGRSPRLSPSPKPVINELDIHLEANDDAKKTAQQSSDRGFFDIWYHKDRSAMIILVILCEFLTLDSITTQLIEILRSPTGRTHRISFWQYPFSSQSETQLLANWLLLAIYIPLFTQAILVTHRGCLL